VSEQKCGHCTYPLDKDGKCTPCENRRLASGQADRREAGGSAELIPSRGQQSSALPASPSAYHRKLGEAIHKVVPSYRHCDTARSEDAAAGIQGVKDAIAAVLASEGVVSKQQLADLRAEMFEVVAENTKAHNKVVASALKWKSDSETYFTVNKQLRQQLAAALASEGVVDPEKVRALYDLAWHAARNAHGAWEHEVPFESCECEVCINAQKTLHALAAIRAKAEGGAG